MAMKIKKKKRGSGDEPSPEDQAAAVGGDPFMKATVGTASWVEENRALVVVAVVVVFVLSIGGYFGVEYLESQKVEASNKLSPAFEAYSTFVEGSPELEQIDQNPNLEKPDKTFDKPETRWQKIYDTATETLEQHGSGEIAQSARLSKAAAAIGLGKPDEAIGLYEAYLEKARDDVGKLAVYQGLASAYAHQEKWEKAAENYEKIAELDAAYQEYALYARARVLEEAGKGDEAKDLYHEILDEYPSSQHKADIERRLATL